MHYALPEHRGMRPEDKLPFWDGFDSGRQEAELNRAEPVKRKKTEINPPCQLAGNNPQAGIISIWRKKSGLN